MTSKTASYQHQRARRTTRALAGGAALALAVGVGLGTWQVRSHGGRAAIGPTTGGEAAQGQAPAARRIPGDTNSGATTTATTPSVYLVGSAAQAHAVQQGLDQVAIAWQPLDATVVQVADDEEARTVLRAYAEENAFGATLGLPAIQVVDLRANPTAPGT
jgi:hypothetical protein